MHTSVGDIRLELFPNVAPVTVQNFVDLAKGEREWVDPNTGKTMVDTPLYNVVIFHRVIDGFMIQKVAILPVQVWSECWLQL